MKSENITQVYKKALRRQKNVNFKDVISFCENDNECRDDNSLKKNVLIFWSYKNIAEYYEKEKKYIKAYDFWLKAWNVAFNSSLKIKIAYHLLAQISKLHLSINEKAQEIVRICNYLQNEYENANNIKGALRISKLQEKALKLLNRSKYLH